jgi:hypothetical protein
MDSIRNESFTGLLSVVMMGNSLLIRQQPRVAMEGHEQLDVVKVEPISLLTGKSLVGFTASSG